MIMRMSTTDSRAPLEHGRASTSLFLHAVPATCRLDMDAYVDLIRRLQTPWYEEARSFFQTESIQNGWGIANEVAPYDPESLRQIAEEGRASENAI
jgi:hypothetical protein